MVHFTCDLCGKDLSATGDPRFVVKIEVFPGYDPDQITEQDLDEDHMEALAQMLQRDPSLSLCAPDPSEAPSFKGFRYDLCPACRQRFVRDPLGRNLIKSFDFSEN